MKKMFLFIALSIIVFDARAYTMKLDMADSLSIDINEKIRYYNNDIYISFDLDSVYISINGKTINRGFISTEFYGPCFSFHEGKFSNKCIFYFNTLENKAYLYEGKEILFIFYLKEY